jgi:parallel beta-helix repeat protein
MQNPLISCSVALIAALALLGCDEPPAEPDIPAVSSLSVGPAAQCPTSANAVVGDEAGLVAAIAVASPGDVIAIEGYFGMTADIFITIEDLTLTCATPGSGLYAESGAGVIDILGALADGVTIDGLVLDGSNTRDEPFFAWQAAGVRFTNNTVTCGPYTCAFFGYTPGTVIEGNYFESHGSSSGVHLQSGIDGSVVRGNTVVSVAPSGYWAWGGIRLIFGDNVVVAQNDVSGPWQNSMSPWFISNSSFSNNTVEGAVWDGLFFRSAWDNVIRNNRATGSGDAGVFAWHYVCGNTFLGNNLNGNYNDWGVIFTQRTGANSMAGNQNVVIDDGNYDCDDDDAVDPNIITGSGAVEHGVILGRVISEAASSGKYE